MPKIIFTSRYMRDVPPTQLENYVRYIGTREGVEKIDESKRMLPATENQRQLIRQLLRDIPASKEMLEYTDFLLQPTIGNASEFISCTLEQNLDLVSKRENVSVKSSSISPNKQSCVKIEQTESVRRKGEMYHGETAAKIECRAASSNVVRTDQGVPQ